MQLDEVPTLDELDQTLNSTIADDRVMLISEVAKTQKHTGDRYSSGLKDFDDAMQGGFKDGDLVIISGQSGEGKTTFAQTLTFHLTGKSIPCLWFSYEVTIDQIDQKFQEMGINDHYFAYTPQKNTTGQLEWIKYKIREAWIRYATKVIFIDHIDFLVPNDVKGNDNREVMLKNIAIQLKTMAIELRVVIVLMCHLKKLNDRNVEPEMVDIGYSAGIFQNADYVFLVIREKIKNTKYAVNENTGDIATNSSKIKIVKNRQTGILKYLKLVYANGKFNELSNLAETGNPDFGRVESI